MNYLFSYLRSLSGEEERRALALQLSPQQQNVLRAVARAANRNQKDREELLAGLSISATNFDKTCSLLLKRIAGEISGEGYFLLSDLRNRNLYPLLLHEIKKQEKQIRQESGEQEDLREFYWNAFKLADSTSEFGYQAGETMRLLDQYIPLAELEEPKSFRVAVELHYRITADMRQGNFEEVLQDTDACLPQISDIIDRGEDLPKYYAHRAFAQYYSLLKVDIQQRIEHLAACLDIAHRSPRFFSKRDIVLTEAAIAESEYYRDNLREALERYQRIFSDHPDVLERDSYHILKVAQIGMILGEYQYVETMIRRWFGEPPYRVPSPPLCLALVCIADDRLEEAHEHIRNGFATNQNNVIYDAHFRILETFYFTFRGDHDFAASLIEKHVKYLRSHGMGVKQSNFPRILHLIRDIVNGKLTGKPLTKRYQEYYDHLQFGARRQYGVLLDKLRNA